MLLQAAAASTAALVVILGCTDGQSENPGALSASSSVSGPGPLGGTPSASDTGMGSATPSNGSASSTPTTTNPNVAGPSSSGSGSASSPVSGDTGGAGGGLGAGGATTLPGEGGASAGGDGGGSGTGAGGTPLTSSGGSNAEGGNSGNGSGGSDGEAGASGAGTGGSAGAGGGAGMNGNAGVANSGGAGSSDYAPCPENGPCKIMPFGDSITEGCCNFVGGYRVPLFQMARQEGHDITFVGSVSNGPMDVDGVPFPRNHEGHGGYTIDDEPSRGANGISPFVATSLPNYTPDIITLMIGTNDLNGNIDVADAPSRLGVLLDSIHAVDSEVLIVLAQIVPTRNDGTNQVVQNYNAAIPGLVAERAEAGRHIVLVDMYTAFIRDADYKTVLLADNLHPGDAGYTRMGETWYDAISGYLR